MLLVLNDTTECQFVDPSDDCTFYFLYYEDQRTDNLTVWVKEEKGKSYFLDAETLVR